MVPDPTLPNDVLGATEVPALRASLILPQGVLAGPVGRAEGGTTISATPSKVPPEPPVAARQLAVLRVPHAGPSIGQA